MKDRSEDRTSLPKLALMLLKYTANKDVRYSILGDFEESYLSILNAEGRMRAGIWCWTQIVKSIPSFLMAALFWRGVMFRCNFKIAFRIFKRQGGYSFINISGLAIGIACCALLFLLIQYEQSFDKHHENAERIFRVTTQYESDGTRNQFARTSVPLAPALSNEFQGIEKVVRFAKDMSFVTYENKRFYENIYSADPDVFNVFTIDFIQGNAKTALNDPDEVVISERISKKYFGENDSIGKVLTFDEKKNFKVAGVFRDIPTNSHLKFDILASFAPYANWHSKEWGISNYYTYILVQENFSRAEYKEKLPDFVEKYRGSEARGKASYPLQPITSIHLHSHLKGEIGPNGDFKTLFVFSAVGLIILLIACFNYINLSTARSITRAREIGLRRIIGASRSQLRKQFLGESVLYTFIALILAVILMRFLLPVFSSLSGAELGVSYANVVPLIFFFIGILFLVGIFSGSFVSLFISRFQPVKAIKGAMIGGSRISLFRRSLIIIQFAASIIFIIVTIIIFNQLQYSRNKNLGFDKDHVLMVPIHDKIILQRSETIKNEIKLHHNVLNVSTSSFFPGGTVWNNNYWHEGMAENEYSMMQWIAVDHEFLDTLRIELSEGRNFSKGFPTDTYEAYILNESAVKEIGWELPIGKQFQIVKRGTVIGVVKDFHFRSLHQKIEPIALTIYPEGFQYFFMRIRPDNVPKTLEFLENKWKLFLPGQSFDYSFLDEDFNNLYKTEMRLSQIFVYTSMISIFIACLGLFGLITFMAEKRTKEIGIRKILGSSIYGIVKLLSKEYFRWILIANVIAWPIAYYVSTQWLENFAYRIKIEISVFFLAAVIGLLIAVLTVSYQSIRAAIANPVDSLRYE